MKFSEILPVLLLLACLVIPAGVLAEVAPDLSAPVKITADRLEVDDLARTLIFSGQALARQGDLTIAAQQLIVHYAQDNRDIVEIIADGEVRITQGERTATGRRAVYERQEGRVVLTGSPLVQDGQSSVQGHEITLFLDGRRSLVQGGEDGRVQAVFQPETGAEP